MLERGILLSIPMRTIVTKVVSTSPRVGSLIVAMEPQLQVFGMELQKSVLWFYSYKCLGPVWFRLNFSLCPIGCLTHEVLNID